MEFSQSYFIDNGNQISCKKTKTGKITTLSLCQGWDPRVWLTNRVSWCILFKLNRPKTFLLGVGGASPENFCKTQSPVFWHISGVQSKVKIVSWKWCFSLFSRWKKSESLYKSFLYITDNCHIDCYHLFQDYLEQDIKHIYLPTWIKIDNLTHWHCIKSTRMNSLRCL